MKIVAPVVFGVIVTASVWAVGGIKGNIGEAWNFVITGPNYWIGQHLRVSDKILGYLREVSTHQVTLVHKDAASGVWTIHTPSLKRLRECDLEITYPVSCAGVCGGLNRIVVPEDDDHPEELSTNECEWDAERHAAAGRGRWLAL